MRYAMFRVAVPCRGCGARAPADRPRQRLPCPGCGRELEIAATAWGALIGQAAGRYEALADGQGHQGAASQEQPLDWLYGRKHPVCAGCGAELAASDGGDTDTSVRCAGCSKPQTREPPPAWLRAQVPQLAEVWPAGDGPHGGCFYLGLEPFDPAGQAAGPQLTADVADGRKPAPSPGGEPAPAGPARGAPRVRRRLLGGAAALVALSATAVTVWRLAPGPAPPEATRPKPPPPPPPTEMREAQLRWRASVLKAEGWPLAAGTGCIAALDVVSDGEKLHDAALAIHCGDAELHGPRATTPKLECMLFEGPAFDAESHEYDAACKRHAPGAELPQLLFDTRRRQALLTSTDPAYRVELELIREDGELAGPALFRSGDDEARSFEDVIVRQGSVARATGAARVEVGARCRVALAPTPLAEMPCRVRVQCGSRRLYGGFGQGFTRCVIADGAATIAMDDGVTDQDGDPRLRVDLPAGQVRVRDVQPEREVRIELDP